MSHEESWQVYIIKTVSGKLYTGITKDINRRFAEHLDSEKGATFFRISAPEQVLFQESHPNRSSATKREIEIKKMSRQQKEQLISKK